MIDHKNMLQTDNTRDNLRRVSMAQNKMNAGKHRDNSSGYKGVAKHRSGWVAQIGYGGRSHYVGLFRTKEAAALAYDAAARKHHGEFARLNFPEDK